MPVRRQRKVGEGSMFSISLQGHTSNDLLPSTKFHLLKGLPPPIVPTVFNMRIFGVAFQSTAGSKFWTLVLSESPYCPEFSQVAPWSPVNLTSHPAFPAVSEPTMFTFKAKKSFTNGSAY
jgi:hypothetical protein